MSRVITFSTRFPAKHPKAGKPTHFPEQVLRSLSIPDYWEWFDKINDGIDTREFRTTFYYPESGIKYHTIRAGNRWKVGDKFSPRIWGDDINPKSGRKGAYQSKQIIFGPDIELKKIWSFRISYGRYYVNEQEFLLDDLTILARNDGLAVDDFEAWFACHAKKRKEDFIGQILCWNENIIYPCD